MDVQKSQKPETIKMVERALRVLDILRASRNSLGVNELAKMADLNPTTTFRILKTIEKSGWVFQLSDNRYITGSQVGFLTEKNSLYLALIDVSQFVMERLTAKYNQAMNLSIRDGMNCTIIQQSRTKSFVDYVPPKFSNMPFYSSAAGKILLSESPSHLVEMIINSCEMKPLTSQTITDPEQFRHCLQVTAKQGYAFDNRESSENGSCIGVPVRDHEGTIIAALSFSGFIGVNNPQELLDYLPALQEASEEITCKLYKCWKW